jgi:ubiquinone/menaquinone biosynthesis C-methylase UbiE
MATMSRLEAAFCRSPAWDLVAGRALLPWALQGRRLGDANALEVGAGDGSMAAALLKREPEVRLTLTDLDPEMVARAADRLDGRATARQADVTKLPFDDGAFDVAMSFLMLHHVGQWEAAVGELVRVVRPGGRLFLYDLLDGPVNRWVHRISRSPGVKLLSKTDAEGIARRADIEDARLKATAGVVFRLAAKRRAQ